MSIVSLNIRRPAEIKSPLDRANFWVLSLISGLYTLYLKFLISKNEPDTSFPDHRVVNTTRVCGLRTSQCVFFK
ncbi:hypothetical protein PoB_006172000 [Plakobranchus ocellatus]|uniref:Uncharacterized protein n=1 Tax=Plakobranchus ocellatus TaxID=259542 RepID=A0AAV4CTN4_9GAST|nr:hypothetical protein PoB_006172000 [Plakobranchus ocellatus]